METEKRSGGIPAPAPLFRDPVYDCPTDPVMIWNRREEQWFLFYTQRRATELNIGVSYVHGTKIGVASSRDGGRWLYRGTLDGLDIEPGHNTLWAPEILFADSQYHMFVSYITGIPTDWDEPRQMLHYTSGDLWSWRFEGRLDLHSDRVIDACVYPVGEGLYKMWYKDESHGSMTTAALSRDLYTWEVVGEEIHDCSQEGPNVFELDERAWMVSDYWQGLAVYRSGDFQNWTRCPDILDQSGTRPMDCGVGHHADVLVERGRAYIFYFCHPGAESDSAERQTPPEQRRNCAVVQVAELRAAGDHLVCDRNAPVLLDLSRPF